MTRENESYAWKVQREWIKDLSIEEAHCFKIMERREEKKLSRAYSTGNGGAVIVRGE